MYKLIIFIKFKKLIFSITNSEYNLIIVIKFEKYFDNYQNLFEPFFFVRRIYITLRHLAVKLVTCNDLCILLFSIHYYGT